jgi:hypothetical protein
MARGRLISRTLGSSRKFAALIAHAGKLGEFAQSLYPLLVANSDDHGRMAGDAFTVKHAVFPTSARKESEFGSALLAMHNSRLIHLYEANGLQLIQIMDFDAHQPGLHKRVESKFPGSPGKFPEIPAQSNRRELKGIEEKGTALRAVDEFDGFWSAYPKKKSKTDAERAWRKLAPSADLVQRILTAVASQRLCDDWTKSGGQFIPFPASWLNARRWEDEMAVPETPPEAVDWFEECREMHGGDCGLSQQRHAQRKYLDANRKASA